MSEPGRNYVRFADGAFLTLDPSTGKYTLSKKDGTVLFTVDTSGNVAAGGTGTVSPVSFASLQASAKSKQGAVITSDYTQTSATFTNVTGAEVVSNGPAIVIATAQVVTAASVTGGALQVKASAGNVSGAWFMAVDGATVGDVTNFGITFGAPAAQVATANITAALTLDAMFVGWASAAATLDLQAQSDGTRTITVKVGSQIASSV